MDFEGSKRETAGCRPCAVVLLEWCGVSKFSGGMFLRLVILTLHTLHSLFCGLILGFALPDLIRWEAILAAFSLSYTWFDIRFTMLSARLRHKHFKPKSDEPDAATANGDVLQTQGAYVLELPQEDLAAATSFYENESQTALAACRFESPQPTAVTWTAGPSSKIHPEAPPDVTVRVSAP